jgi:hypothetical protein
MCVGIVLLIPILLVLFMDLHLGHDRTFLAGVCLLGIPVLLSMCALSLIRNKFYLLTVFFQLTYLVIYSVCLLPTTLSHLDFNLSTSVETRSQSLLLQFSIATISALAELITILIQKRIPGSSPAK